MNPPAVHASSVLIVEDEALIAEETADRLTALGYQVLGIADNGPDAIALAARLRPAAVLMDIRLKGSMSGIEAARQIYQQQQTPIIFASAHSDRETLQRAQIDAQFGYIVKPYRDNDLAMALRVALHRHHVEAQLRQSRLTHEAILSSINDCVVVADDQGRVGFMNLPAAELLGCHATDCFDKPLQNVLPLLDEQGRQSITIDRTLASGTTCMLNNRHGQQVHMEITITPVEDATQQEIGTTLVLKDVTEKKRQGDLIWRQAHFDDLTALPNRSMFRQQLQAEIHKAHVLQRSVTLLLLDLDNFKQVNDTLGHAQGDELLRLAAGRIQSCLRRGDSVARLGGDEFAIILPGLSDPGRISQLAKRLIGELSIPVLLAGKELATQASIGIALFPQDAQQMDDLLKYADQAMYTAKEQGRNRFAFFTPSIAVQQNRRALLLQELRNALELGQMQLHYQPIIDLAGGHIAKAEALLRWQHPQLGMISPLEFIPLAEESNLIVPIGQWVLEEAARCARLLHAQCGRWICINVNVSAKQLNSPAFTADHWLAQLHAQQLPHHALAMEITESTLVEDSVLVKKCLTGFFSTALKSRSTTLAPAFPRCRT